MSITKDESIVTQVAAKIAADLAVAGGDIQQRVADWAIAFDAVKDCLFEAHGTMVAQQVEQAAQAVMQAMPGSTVVTPQEAGFTVRVAGKQHGDLPSWLVSACQRQGITEVWDNRDKAVGTNKPWFRQAGVATADAVAFWPPKGR